ncbi:hypothetical protein ACAH01_00450 [Halomicrobium sp. HM KBTZ05]|uniref:hypothetical protein n=1 Tax=Halomicrobium sp. HM KBTZ05 TaxID=3242663 RepID=UPI003557F587
MTGGARSGPHWQSYLRLVNTVFADDDGEGPGDIVPAVGDLVDSATSRRSGWPARSTGSRSRTTAA